MFHKGDLPKLDLQLDRGSEFKACKSQWESYSSLSGLADEAAGKQVQALTLCFSRDALAIVQNLGLTEEQKGNAQAIIDAIQRYLKGGLLDGDTIEDLLQEADLTLPKAISICQAREAAK